MAARKGAIDWTRRLLAQIAAAGLPDPVTEYPFAKATTGREWRADLAWPAERLLVEIEGGIHSRGRHVRGVGYEDDCEKYSWAAALGYAVLRFPTGSGRPIANGRALLMIRLALGAQLSEAEWTQLVPPKARRGRPRKEQGDVHTDGL